MEVHEGTLRNLRPFLLLLVLLALGSLVFLAADPAHGAILKVGPGETYTEIQDAVDAASSGDTVEVAAGTYDEDLVIDVDIEIHGNTQANTVINGTGTGSVVTINVSGVELYKFTIKGARYSSSEAGIYMANATNCTIREVTIDGLRSNGIYLTRNCSDTTIEDCTITGNSYDGISVRYSSSVTVDSNDCSDNGNSGIRISYCDNCTVTQNTCNDGREGIRLSSCYDTLVEDNDCDSNSNYGIIVVYCENTTVADNECSSEGTNGISLSVGRDLMVSGNTCSFNGGRGIFVYMTVNASVEENLCKGNDLNGIELIASSRDYPMACRVINNTCTDNAYDGISVSLDTSYNLVSGNDCSENGRSGISIDSAHHNTVRDNDCSYNGRHGIELPRGTTLQPTEYNVVDNNTLEFNDLDGIYIDSMYHVIVNNSAIRNRNGINCLKDNILMANNTCNQNSGDGILCQKANYWIYMVNVTLINNSCGLNDHGIIFLHMDSCVVEGNKCSGNEYAGIDVAGFGSTIRGNEMGTNRGNGLNVSGTSARANTIEDNVCYYNLRHGIYASGLRDLVLVNNSGLLNGLDGIRLASCHNLTLSDGVLFQNDRNGIGLSSSSDTCRLVNNTFGLSVDSGIKLEANSDECTITGNVFLEGHIGINMTYADHTTVLGNTFDDCDIGIRMNQCWWTLVYDNWLDCTTNSQVIGGGENQWNITKTAGTNICGFGFLGGNYWNDYHGVDQDGDWIGDTNLPHGPGDHLPLIKEMELPEIDDLTSGTPTTGETFDILVDVTDNRGVGNVFLLYWFGQGTPANITMDRASGDSFNMTIDVPDDSLDELRYIIVAVDMSDNWNRTVQRNVTVVDNDVPSIDATVMDLNATTGDPFEFTVRVVDNVAIGSVWLEYWYNGTPVETVDLHDFGSDLWKAGITMEHRVVPLHFIAYVNDTSGNQNRSVNMSVTLVDNDAPSISWWSTFDHLETGGNGTFAVRASDNIGVERVQVEFWFGENPHQTRDMGEVAPGMWEYGFGVPVDSLDPLHYGFHVRDAAGNLRSSAVWVATVRDVIPPVILSDGTGHVAVAGEDFSFLVSASDNIAPKEAWVRYSFGDGMVQNSSMEELSAGSFAFTINVPLALDPLNYTFHVRDGANRWTSSGVATVQVIDGTPPTFISDSTKSDATTGDPFRFMVDVRDDVGVAEVWVEVDTGADEVLNSSAEWVTAETWQLMIEVPDDAKRTWSYHFSARDEYGNWASTPVKELTIADNDPPEIGAVRMNVIWRYDEEREISVDVTDNKYVWDVWVMIVDPSGRDDKYGMSQGEGDAWTVTLSLGQLGDYGVTIWAVDTDSNRMSLECPDIEVRDTKPPAIGTITIRPDAPETGEVVNISVRVTDDFGLEDVWLEQTTPGGETSNETMIEGNDGIWYRSRTLSEAGNYTLTVVALDHSENWNRSLTVTLEVLGKDDGGNGDGGDGGGDGGGEEPDGETTSGVPSWLLAVVIAVIVVVAVVAGVLAWTRSRKGPET